MFMKNLCIDGERNINSKSVITIILVSRGNVKKKTRQPSTAAFCSCYFLRKDLQSVH